MNLVSALIKRVLELEDFSTWSNVRKHYLPNEYHKLFDVISGHTDNYHKLPTIEELKLEIRDSATLDKVYALETIETEAEPFLLLDYVKNDFAQKEVLIGLDRWIDSSIAFESAEEVVQSLERLTSDLKDRVDLVPPEENMQKINLFDTEEDMSNRITLGLNADFDKQFDFLTTDFILIGGKRGSGKSLTSNNIARHIIDSGKRVVFFTVEMTPREVLQRDCGIATGVSVRKIRNRDLSIPEWEEVVKYWANRYEDSENDVKQYYQHRDFNRFHSSISRKNLVANSLEIVYDSGLTMSKIISESTRLARDGNLGLIVIDYLNKVKRTGSHFTDSLDWKEQMYIANASKQLAQDLKVPTFSPYQTDANGEARLAKGILDAADAALVLDAHTKKDNAITFKTTKMRAADDEEEFTSSIDWSSLKIGPANAEKPQPIQKSKPSSSSGKTGENIYDDPPF